ncbi:hypothetical protein [Pseudomonas khavaziana]|uniref:hypothetical protein n=1 Tax=Pseudomonas khavaziana TaxID=2842351 RepID=UPI001C3D9BA0|nr:hypothetical protein [Pseudomonas khavaziana]MBV4483808.1 hypothetical protein [Pseudomonas khavaziana]
MLYADQLDTTKKTVNARADIATLNDNNTKAHGANLSPTTNGLGEVRSAMSSLHRLTQSVDMGRKGMTEPVLSSTASQVDFFKLGFQDAIGPHQKNILKDCVLQASLELLLETALKLTRMNKNTTETFVPVIKLIREIRTVLIGEHSNLANLSMELRDAINVARTSLKDICPDSSILRAADILCDLADILHKGLTSPDLSDLKEPLQKLAVITELSPICSVMMPLLELGSQFQKWNSEKITDQDLLRSLLENILPEQLSLLFRMGEKISDAVQSGRLHVERLPAWPGIEDKMGCLQWLKIAFNNHSLREVLATADSRWLMEILKYDAEEAEYAQKYLLQYVQPLLHFPTHGPIWEQVTALTKIPGLSEIFTQADICLNDNLGVLGSLLKDNTTLSQLGGLMTTPGAVEKGWEALKFVDTRKSLMVVKNMGLAVLEKTFGLATDAARATWFVVKKGHDFWESAYSAGQSLSDPVRLYRDVFSFIRDDIKNSPSDYQNATVETLLATLAVVIKSFGGNHVSVNWKGNTAEWLNAYAEADPQKLSAIDKILMYTVLEPRIILEVKHAIQQEDAVQARQLLEPLSDALKSYAGGSSFLHKIASLLPYIPAIAEAWKEILDIDRDDRKKLRSEFQQQSGILIDILHNSPKDVSPETMEFRQKSITSLYEKLSVVQQKCGERPDKISLLQVELDAMKAALESQGDEIRNRLTNELFLVQNSLDHLRNERQRKELSADSIPQLLAVQENLLTEVRKTLVQEGVSSAEIMLAQLQKMTAILNSPTIQFTLTDIGSTITFATEVLAKLAKSKKPNVVAVRCELATMLRNEASDRLVDAVHWTKKQLMQFCTKEVELVPEDKALGLFLIERDLSTEQLATGGAVGAASATLLSALFLFCFEEGSLSCKPRMKASGGNKESRQRTLTLPQSGAYFSHSMLRNQDSSNLKKYLKLALPILVGAVAGVGIAATVKPAIREKYREDGMTSANDPARIAEIGESLYTFKENGIDFGIYLSEDNVNAIKESPQNRLPKRSYMRQIVLGVKEEQRRKVRIQKREDQSVQPAPKSEQRNASGYYLPVNNESAADYQSEIVDLSKLSRFRRRVYYGYAKQEPDHFYLPGSPERDSVISEFDFALCDSAEDILEKYLRYLYSGYGGGISYDNILINDIGIKYKTSNDWTIVTPKQLVTGQAEGILKAREGSIISSANALREKDYSFPSNYPETLKTKLKAAKFWSETTDKIIKKLTNSELVRAHAMKIRARVELAISVNSEEDISKNEMAEKLSRAKPVMYKGRLVAGMFVIPHTNNSRKVKLYSINPQFKAVETETDQNIMHHLNESLKTEILKGYHGEISNSLFKPIYGAPNMDPIFHAWTDKTNGIENILLKHITDKIYRDVDLMTVSAGEQYLLHGLEILKWGMRIASVPLGMKGAGIAALIESLAGIIQAQLSNNKDHAEEYIQEACWGIVFEIVGGPSIEMLTKLGARGLKEVSEKINKIIRKIKNAPSEKVAKRELNVFSDFVSEQQNIQVSIKNKKVHEDYQRSSNALELKPGISDEFKRGYDAVSNPGVLQNDVAEKLPGHLKYDIFKLMASFIDNKAKLSNEQLGALKKYIEHRHAQYLENKADTIMNKIGKSFKTKILSSHNLSQGALFVSAQRFGINREGRCFPLTIISLCSFAAGKSDDFYKNINFIRTADISNKNKINSYMRNIDALHIERKVGRSGQYVNEFKDGGVVIKFSPDEIANKLTSADNATSQKYFQIITPGNASKSGHAMSVGFNINQGSKRYQFYDPNTGEIVFSDRDAFTGYVRKYLKDAEVVKTSNAEIINGKPTYELRELDAASMHADLSFRSGLDFISFKDMLNLLEKNSKYP